MTTTTDKIPATTLGPPDERCGECSTVLATDQRYCLNCGLRRGDPRVDPLSVDTVGTGPAVDARNRLSISRGRAVGFAVAIAIGGIIVGTVIDGGGDSTAKQTSTPAATTARPTAANAAQDAEKAQKDSENAPDTLVTK